jgi:hypothetical protein
MSSRIRVFKEGGCGMRKYFPISGLFLCILLLYGCGGADPLETGTVTLTADPTTVEANGICTLTATVTYLDNAGATVPAMGKEVTFQMLTANGGHILVVNNRTASGGVAKAIYTAGNNLFPDVVRVTTSDGATAALTIKKTGLSAFGITASAAPATLTAANSNSVITATVKNNEGTFVNGLIVTFTVTGGGTVAPASATTGGNGNAVTIFTGNGGATGDTSVVTASVTVSGNTYTAAVVITYP